MEYHGSKEAEKVIVIMGASALTCENLIEKMAEKGEKVGMINIRLWKPFDC